MKITDSGKVLTSVPMNVGLMYKEQLSALGTHSLSNLTRSLIHSRNASFSNSCKESGDP